MIKLNAVGKSDPLPMVRDALAKGADEIQVSSMDTAPALMIKKFLEEKGFGVQIQDDNGLLTLTGSHKKFSSTSHGPRPAPVPQAQVLAVPIVGERKTSPLPGTKRRPRPTYLILDRKLGRFSSEESKSSELGEILMKSFLSALTKASVHPAAIILMNEGVKLALFNTSTCDHLKVLESQGARVLVSGTCVMHFGLTESIGAGVLANMHEIIETLNNAEKCITL